MAAYGAPTQEEKTAGGLQDEIFKSMGILSTQGTRERELQVQAGLPDKKKEVQTSINRLRALQAEQMALPMQIQQDAEGRGVTAAGVAPLEAGKQRQLAIEQLRTSAFAQALMGDISAAQADIESALKAEFEPERMKLDMLKQAYEMNRDALSRIDKKRSEALSVALNERDRLLNVEQTNRNEIYQIGLTARKYGADDASIKKITDARTREEALSAAGAFLQDPKAKYELEAARLDTVLKKQQINKMAYEFELLQKYGGMTPTEYAASIKAEQKAIKEAKDAQEAATLQGAALQEKMTLLGATINSKGMDSVVGTTLFSRAPGSGKSFAARVFGGAATGAATGAAIGAFAGGVGAIPGALFGGAAGAIGGLGLASQGAVDKVTGQRQQFIASVEQFVSKEFIDSLIEAKAAGATFGALTQSEQAALTSAATKIGTWRMTDDKGNVLGYNTSEANMKAELAKVQAITRKAYETATGNAWTPDEQEMWEELEAAQSTSSFNPAF
jgi:hypothetical protein